MEILHSNSPEGGLTPDQAEPYSNVVDTIETLRGMERVLDDVSEDVFDLNQKINELENTIKTWRENKSLGSCEE